MQNIIQQLSNTIQAVHDGEVSALEVWANIKELSDHIAKCKAEIESAVLQEAAKCKGEVHYGYAIEVRPSAGRWSFDAIPEWKQAKDSLAKIEEAAKASFKAYEKGIRSVNDDGELITPAVYVPGKDTVFLSKKGGKP